jgi:hypothetical protein
MPAQDGVAGKSSARAAMAARLKVDNLKTRPPSIGLRQHRFGWR